MTELPPAHALMGATIVKLCITLRSALSTVTTENEADKAHAFSTLESLYNEVGLYNWNFFNERITHEDFSWYLVNPVRLLRSFGPNNKPLSENLTGVIDYYARENSLRLRLQEREEQLYNADLLAGAWLNKLAEHRRGSSSQLVALIEEREEIKVWNKTFSQFANSVTFSDRFKENYIRLSKISEEENILRKSEPQRRNALTWVLASTLLEIQKMIPDDVAIDGYPNLVEALNWVGEAERVVSEQG